MSAGIIEASVAAIVVVVVVVLFVRRTIRADRAVGEIGANRLATWHHTGLTRGGRSDDDRWPGT